MIGVTRRVRLRISGLVQGVFFRESTRRQADSLDIRGWVRNQPDGSVEALFEGDSGKVERLIEWAKRGPIGAEVDEVEVTEEPYAGEFSRFSIEY